MAYQTVLTATINLVNPSVVEATVNAQQTFNVMASGGWGFILTIDGNVVRNTGRKTAPGDVVTFNAYQQCPAGARTVTLQWAADSNISLDVCVMTVEADENTQLM